MTDTNKTTENETEKTPQEILASAKAKVAEPVPTEEKKKPGIPVRSLPPIKLKDKVNRNVVFIELEKTFGFYPEVIIIEKVRGSNNKIVIHAQVTQTEIDRITQKLEMESKKAEEEKVKVDKVEAKPTEGEVK